MLARRAAGQLNNLTADLIDKHTGLPDGERILQGLALLAVGTPDQVEAFFGEPVRMRARDRRAALTVLESRRFGRVPSLDDQTPDVRPVTIVNVFSTSAEYDFVTQARPKQVGPASRQLEAGHDPK